MNSNKIIYNEIKNRDFVDEKEFIRQYSKFIHNLNAKNASRIWWANNFTNKNPLLTALCKNIYDFLCIKKLAEKNPGHIIVAVLSDVYSAKFLKKWAKKKNIQIEIKLSLRLKIKSLIIAFPCLLIFYNFLKVLARMMLSKLNFRSLPSRLTVNYIFVTQFEKSCFKENGIFHDVYFGRLKDFLEKEGKSFMTCGFLACPFKNLLVRSKNFQNRAIYPLEYFLTVKDVLAGLKDIIAAYFKINSISGSTSVDGEEIRDLVKREIKSSFDSGGVFINFLVYFSVKNLLDRVSADKILYPFENRSWEKLILMAARDSQKQIKLSGYQHASLTPKHINFILEEEEMNTIPFPDEIISMGKITKDLLENVFAFPKNFVKIGCALRQDRIFGAQSINKNSGKFTRLLIALASSLDEYARTLRFLDAATLNDEFSIKIRPHPAIDFNRALKIYRPRKFKFEIDENKKLLDSLSNSDIVLYVSSTVSLEALSIGKPVIYLDFGNFLNSDPLFNFSEFKWHCNNPSNLAEIIDQINLLDSDIFKKKQNEGISYTKDYFYPVDNKTIEAFLQI